LIDPVYVKLVLRLACPKVFNVGIVFEVVQQDGPVVQLAWSPSPTSRARRVNHTAAQQQVEAAVAPPQVLVEAACGSRMKASVSKTGETTSMVDPAVWTPARYRAEAGSR